MDIAGVYSTRGIGFGSFWFGEKEGSLCVLVFVRCVGLDLVFQPVGSCWDDANPFPFEASDVKQDQVVFDCNVGVVELADFRHSCTSVKQCCNHHQRRVLKNTRDRDSSGMSVADWLRLVGRRFGI